MQGILQNGPDNTKVFTRQFITIFWKKISDDETGG